MNGGRDELAYAPTAAPAGGGRAYVVPADEAERQRLRAVVAQYLRGRLLVPPLLMSELERHADALLAAHPIAPVYREFLFILINNAVWTPHLRCIPFERRVLMLPPCLRESAACRAAFDELGLLCERCGECAIGPLSDTAEDMGYTVIVAEGTTIVASLVGQGRMDAMIGVGCMAALERSFPRMVAAAVPGLAIPLLQDGCSDTAVDQEWVGEALRLAYDPDVDGGGQFRMLDLTGIQATVREWFDPQTLRAQLRMGTSDVENLSLDWLARSGKRWRPFLTTAVAMALTGEDVSGLSGPTRAAAVAMECIHKASLVYDDIQDGDEVRYGEPTLHTLHGVPVAMTVSLYLLGLGYRVLAEAAATDGQRAAMLRLATDGHCRLCLGQGDELIWTRKPSRLTSGQVIEILRRKTAPSFEVVLALGGVCAGADDVTLQAIRQYSEALGVAYQIHDDLDDFSAGGDVDDILSHRPSIVLAMACEAAEADERETIAAVWEGRIDRRRANEIRDLIVRYDVEEQVRALQQDYQEQALRALAPLRNAVLKTTLFRVARLVLGGDA